MRMRQFIVNISHADIRQGVEEKKARISDIPLPKHSHILDLKKNGNTQEYDKNIKQVKVNDTYYKICHDLIHLVLAFWHVGYISINTDFISLAHILLILHLL